MFTVHIVYDIRRYIHFLLLIEFLQGDDQFFRQLRTLLHEVDSLLKSSDFLDLIFQGRFVYLPDPLCFDSL